MLILEFIEGFLIIARYGSWNKT